MARIINITNKADNEPIFVTFEGGKQYKVNNSYKAMRAVPLLFQREGVDTAESMIEAIELFYGKKARAEIEEMPIGNIFPLIIAAMAGCEKVDYEVVEARFRGEINATE